MTITAANPLSDRLQLARQASGLSMSQVYRRLIRLLGDDTPTEQTIRNYHKDAPPLPNVLVLVGLAAIYGIRVSDLGDEEINARLETLRDLVDRMPAWITEGESALTGDVAGVC